ncbi:OsmC family protein [Fulvivirga sp. 29W222]|uniref:OsmC family protein n=1 Tax=Fulvivirga marina TaxID=2494733 RepID=A0A937KEN4_9BACT|nr:OsmC family protein [Fulvivirga marina]MBL6447348.1 OsmC family protein [Fulvivirga marina]
MKYTTRVVWNKGPEELFTDNKYSRRHQWSFDGGLDVKASSSPHVIPVPLSDESAVDPEEAFVAALSSCHMLFFLSLAAKETYVVETYEDQAEGVMEENENGKMAMISVTLKPRIVFSEQHKVPDLSEVEALHEKAHNSCFLANSVQSKININL